MTGYWTCNNRIKPVYKTMNKTPKSQRVPDLYSIILCPRLLMQVAHCDRISTQVFTYQPNEKRKLLPWKSLAGQLRPRSQISSNPSVHCSLSIFRQAYFALHTTYPKTSLRGKEKHPEKRKDKKRKLQQWSGERQISSHDHHDDRLTRLHLRLRRKNKNKHQTFYADLTSSSAVCPIRTSYTDGPSHSVQ